MVENKFTIETNLIGLINLQDMKVKHIPPYP
jgi:hypothetical protein